MRDEDEDGLDAASFETPEPAARGKKKTFKKRPSGKSLSGAGMHMTDEGLRRSSRQRVRPLEYWRNEKVVYSRKYASLPTVHHIEVHTPDPVWPMPQPKRRKRESGSMLSRSRMA